MTLEGRHLGEFVIREKISEGGFGDVYRAEQPALEREAVVKVLQARRKHDAVVVSRFMREARLASKFDHPYAAHMYAFGAELDGLLWIAMELVRGTPLDQYLKGGGPMPLARFVPFLEQICEVVHTAHEKGIVHRDLKPANVMVLSRAGRILPKLLDFGLAKVIEGSGAAVEVTPLVPREQRLEATTMADSREAIDQTQDIPTRTEAGMLLGTPAYMPPEQWRASAVADARTDLYALGILCWEMLRGRRPYDGETVDEVRAAHLHDPLPPLGESFPPGLQAVLARATAKDPGERFATVMELAAAVRAASGLAVEAESLPRLSPEARDRAMADAPKPIAEAVLELDAARHAHQARDAMWMVVRATSRYLGVLALSCRARAGVGPARAADSGEVQALIRQLHRRELDDDEWLELARLLTAPFRDQPSLYPVPELVEVLGEDDPFVPLAQAREQLGTGGGEAAARETLVRCLPLVAALLARLEWIEAYPVIVRRGDVIERWMGARRLPRTALPPGGAVLPEGEPALADWRERPLVPLWPLAQVAPPSPGAAAEMFLFSGRRRGEALLVAPPSGFERADEKIWDWFRAHFPQTDMGISAERRVEASPYRGLAPFRAEDARSYFGREAESLDFVNRLRVTPLLAVVGASGAGKSSFVQAGVIPNLPEGWRALTLRPGPAPTAALAARLKRSPAELRAALDADPGALAGILEKERVHLLVVDQLEELFTLCHDAAERERFAAALAGVARGPEEPGRVILTLRDDFLVRAGALAPLRRHIDAGLHVVTVPAAGDLERILVEPARRAGYEFEDAELPREMIAEVEGEPAALALLSFTASRLWELRDRQLGRLMRAAYKGMGGVGGALAGHAEAVLDGMRGDERRLTREIFRHLVTASGTRAVLRRGELLELTGPAGEAVIEKLVGARLLEATEDEGAGGDTIEVIHEALLDAWPRLGGWRAEDAEGMRLRDELRAVARQWQERRQPRGLLWRDDTLAEVERWRVRTKPALTHVEQAFVEASARDARRGRRVARLATITTMAALALAAVVLYLLYRQAGLDRARAEASAADAEQRVAQLYAEQGRQALLAHEPLRALVFLDEALRRGLGSAVNRFLIARGRTLLDRQKMMLTHGESVRWAAFSPDGTRLVTAGADGVAIVWDARSGRELLRLTGHMGQVRSSIFSPDGKKILTAGNDRTIRIWDAESGASLRVLAGHESEVGQALWIAGGERILSRSSDGSLGVWDAASGARLRTLAPPAPAPAVISMGLTRDERLAGAGGGDGTVRVWDLASGALVSELPAKGAVVGVAFSPDGTRLVAAGHNADTVMFDVATRQRLFGMSGPNETVFGIGWAGGDGKTVVVGGTLGMAKVFDATTGELLRTTGAHESLITSMAVSRDGSRIVTGSDDMTVRIFSVRTGKMLALLVGHRAAVTGVDFSPDETLVVSRSNDGTARLWEARPDDLVATLGEHPAALARLTDDGRAVVVGADGTLRMWDARGHELASAPVAGKPIAASADGRRLVLAEEGGVRVVRPGVDEGPLLPAGKVTAAALVEGGVWTAGEGGVALWPFAGGAARVSMPDAALALAVSADGQRVAAAGRDGTIHIYDAAGGPPRRDLVKRARLVVMAFSPDGRRLLAGGFERAATVWDVERGVALSTPTGRSGSVTSVAFSADGTLAATGSSDGAVRVWETSTGKLLYEMDRHEGAVIAVAFGDGARRLLSAAADGARLWDLAPDARPAAEIAREVRCRVPLRLDADVIVPAEAGGEGCR